MKSFLIKSTVLTIIIFIMGAALFMTVLKPHYLPILPIVVLFFYGVTNLVHAYLLQIARKSGSKFTSHYMAASFLKMFLYLAIAIVLVIIDRGNAKFFIANFVLLYLIYTVFEVYEYSKVIKQAK